MFFQKEQNELKEAAEIWNKLTFGINLHLRELYRVDGT